jgi:hypothetical protein
MHLPRPLKIFWKINVVLVLVCAAIIALNHYVWHLGQGVHWQPYTSPFLPWGHFVDFWAFHDRFDHYHTLEFYSTTGGSVFSYPAPLSLVYELFFLSPHAEHSIFTLVTTLPLIGLCILLARAMVAKGISKATASLFVASALLFSYPFWFEYLLGNIEICVFLITAVGILAWLRGNLYLAAALIGAAGSMKIFPFVYLGLFLSRKQYRQFAFGFLTAAVLYPVSIWLACPSFAVALPQIKASSNAIGGLLLQWDWVLINFDHSLFGVYKQLAHLLGYRNLRSAHQLSVYTALVAISGIALYFLRIRRLPLMNQLLSLCVASILLPPMSNDYTLLYLYLPWGLLGLSAIQEARTGRTRAGLLAAFVCFGLLFSPESEIIIRHATVAGQFKALTLLVLLYISLKYPLALPSEQPSLHSTHTDVADATLAG